MEEASRQLQPEEERTVVVRLGSKGETTCCKKPSSDRRGHELPLWYGVEPQLVEKTMTTSSQPRTGDEKIANDVLGKSDPTDGGCWSLHCGRRLGDCGVSSRIYRQIQERMTTDVHIYWSVEDALDQYPWRRYFEEGFRILHLQCGGFVELVGGRQRQKHQMACLRCKNPFESKRPSAELNFLVR